MGCDNAVPVRGRVPRKVTMVLAGEHGLRQGSDLPVSLDNTDNFIRISIYQDIMPKQKITISLDSEIAEKLRLQSIEKYHNSRSMSKLIEDLATGAVEAKQPEACSILGQRSKSSFRLEADFNKTVAEITAQLSKIEIHAMCRADGYFALKEACELRINEMADCINVCWDCNGLSGPVHKYPEAGRNFEIYETMNHAIR
jgi:hypothetical protein